MTMTTHTPQLPREIREIVKRTHLRYHLPGCFGTFGPPWTPENIVRDRIGNGCAEHHLWAALDMRVADWLEMLAGGDSNFDIFETLDILTGFVAEQLAFYVSVAETDDAQPIRTLECLERDVAAIRQRLNAEGTASLRTRVRREQVSERRKAFRVVTK